MEIVSGELVQKKVTKWKKISFHSVYFKFSMLFFPVLTMHTQHTHPCQKLVTDIKQIYTNRF